MHAYLMLLLDPSLRRLYVKKLKIDSFLLIFPRVPRDPSEGNQSASTQDKIDEPSVSTYPSWCADPCLEMVKSLPYLDFMSECFHILLTATIPRQAHAKRAKTRLQSEAKEA